MKYSKTKGKISYKEMMKCRKLDEFCGEKKEVKDCLKCPHTDNEGIEDCVIDGACPEDVK